MSNRLIIQYTAIETFFEQLEQYGLWKGYSHLLRRCTEQTKYRVEWVWYTTLRFIDKEGDVHMVDVPHRTATYHPSDTKKTIDSRIEMTYYQSFEEHLKVLSMAKQLHGGEPELTDALPYVGEMMPVFAARDFLTMEDEDE